MNKKIMIVLSLMLAVFVQPLYCYNFSIFNYRFFQVRNLIVFLGACFVFRLLYNNFYSSELTIDSRLALLNEKMKASSKSLKSSFSDSTTINNINITSKKTLNVLPIDQKVLLWEKFKEAVEVDGVYNQEKKYYVQVGDCYFECCIKNELLSKK